MDDFGARLAVVGQDIPAPHRICVAFLDCELLAKRAAAYLVLTQNRIQRTFEFSVFDFDLMRTALARRFESDLTAPSLEQQSFVAYRADDIDVETYLAVIDNAIDVAKDYVGREATESDVDGEVPRHWVVLTGVRFKGGQYSAYSSEVATVSVGAWHSWIAPPSALEYVLRMVQAYAAAFFLGVDGHYFTRGCLFDYNEYIQDARQMVLVGTICPSCRRLAAANGKLPEVLALEALMDHEWIGQTAATGTVAALLKSVFKYDLLVARGLSPSRLETFWDNLTSSSTQEFVRLVAAILLAFLLLHFGLKSGE